MKVFARVVACARVTNTVGGRAAVPETLGRPSVGFEESGASLVSPFDAVKSGETQIASMILLRVSLGRSAALACVGSGM